MISNESDGEPFGYFSASIESRDLEKEISLPESMDVYLFVPHAYEHWRQVMQAHGGDLRQCSDSQTVVATFPKGTTKQLITWGRFTVCFPDGFHCFRLSTIDPRDGGGTMLTLMADDTHGGQWDGSRGKVHDGQ